MAQVDVNLRNKIVQDWMHRHVGPNAEMYGHAPAWANPYIEGAVASPALYDAIVKNEPQFIQERVADLGGTVNGDTLSFEGAPPSGFGGDWLSPLLAIAGPVAGGLYNGAFAGLGNGVAGGIGASSGAFGPGAQIWGDAAGNALGGLANGTSYQGDYGYPGDVTDATRGVNQRGGSMDLGDWQDFSGGGTSQNDLLRQYLEQNPTITNGGFTGGGGGGLPTGIEVPGTFGDGSSLMSQSDLLKQYFEQNPDANGGFNGGGGGGPATGVDVPAWFGDSAGSLGQLLAKYGIQALPSLLKYAGGSDGQQSPLASILGLGAGGNDLLKVLGGVGSAGIGAYASSKQSDDLKELAKQLSEAEKSRYDDQRGISNSRYADQTAINERRYAELLGIDNSRYADQNAINQNRYAELRDIHNNRYADQNAINAQRYGYAQKQAEAATQRGVDTQNYAKGVVAPSQQRYEGSFQPGFTMSSDPGFMDALNQSSKATLHGLSMNGNPAGSPNAWAQSLQDNYQKMAYPALKDYRAQNAATGYSGPFATASTNAPGYIPINGQTAGFGNTPSPQTAGFGNTPNPQTAGFGQLPGAGNANAQFETLAASLAAKSNIFNSLGGGLSSVTNPKTSVSDLVRIFTNPDGSTYTATRKTG